MMIKSIVLLAVLGVGLCGALNVHDLDNSLASGEEVDDFDESYVSYDLHADLHYFRDDYVNEAFARKKYTNTLITMGGQARDMTNRQVRGAKNPFAVAQKALGKIGVTGDRWDVKENRDQPYQYVALYHGYNSNFVVNKLRANMLRRLANAVKNYLPVLDLAENAGDFKDHMNSELPDIIKATMKQVDEEIREQMKDNDDSSATATIAIVTQKYVVVANVGDNHAFAYNSEDEIINMTPTEYNGLNSGNLFGARASQKGTCEPQVNIFKRNFVDEDGDPAQLHYFMMMSPYVSQLVKDSEANKIILSEIVQHGNAADNEQKLYEDSVTRVIQQASERVPSLNKAFFPEFFQKSDFLAIMVGLNKDYKNIH